MTVQKIEDDLLAKQEMSEEEGERKTID